MELIIKNQDQAQPIEWNYDEVKTYVVESVAKYEGMIVQDDEIPFAKEKRAELNKLAKALDDARKLQKKQVMQQFTVFEGEIKEVTAIITNASKAIDVQVKDYEERCKAAKADEIKQYFGGIEKPADWVSIDHISQSQWLNASFSMSKVKLAINDALERINNDLSVIRALPEYAFEAEEYYSKYADQNTALAATLREVQRLVEQAARKVAVEAEIKSAKKAEQERNQQPEEIMQAGTHRHEMQTAGAWVRFKAFLTENDATALKQFFESRNIEYRALR